MRQLFFTTIKALDFDRLLSSSTSYTPTTAATSTSPRRYQNPQNGIFFRRCWTLREGKSNGKGGREQLDPSARSCHYWITNKLGKKRKKKNFGGLGPFHFRMLIGTDGRTDWRRVYKTLQPVIITDTLEKWTSGNTVCSTSLFLVNPPTLLLVEPFERKKIRYLPSCVDICVRPIFD